MKDGSDVLFVTTGITTQIALEAAAKLAGEGLSAGVLHMHTVKPLDADQLIELAGRVRAVVVAEEHTIIGGLGSAAAETLLEAGVAKPFKRIGFPDVFTEELGSQNDIMGKYGISVEGLCRTARTLLSNL